MKTLKKIIIGLIAIMVSACKPSISIDNPMQKHKSFLLVEFLRKNQHTKNINFGWLPITPKICNPEYKNIESSYCVNLIIEVNSPEKSQDAISKTIAAINEIDANEQKELSGVFVGITVVVRKPGCESAPITPATMHKCFVENQTSFAKIR